jgi:hypothetical protein
MIKKIFIFLFMFVLALANAQTKKPAKGGKSKTQAQIQNPDSVPAEEEKIDPMEALELTLPLEVETDPMTGKRTKYPERKRKNDSLRKALWTQIRSEVRTFWVRTQYPQKGKPGRTQLCMNIVSRDTNLVYCINDSILREPEVAKVLYEKQVKDTMYMLIFVDAFNKSTTDGGLCNAGHETKLFLARWNTKTNRAKWKVKNIASCEKGITNMTKFQIKDWDKSGPLDIRYNRSFFFYEIRFDPEHPELGIQTIKDEAKEARDKDGGNKDGAKDEAKSE